MRVLILSCLWLLLAAPWPAAAQATGNRDPDAARLVTDDLPRFWQAFDAANQAATPAAREAAFARYLDQGSPGLREFDRLRIQGPARLAAAVAAHPRYYASLRGQPARIAAFEASIRASLRNLRGLYPEAVFPDVYFVMGRMNSGGTLSDTGLLIGLEMHGREADTPDAELGEWHRGALKGMAGLPHIVAHELVHYQQRGSDDESLLAASLREGVADFVAELSSGGHINGHVHAWAEPRAPQLWCEFRQRMHGKDYSGWLYGGAPGRPADLGYWVGYRIARAFHERAADKAAAIRGMLAFEDARAFLAASGFAASMADQPCGSNDGEPQPAALHPAEIVPNKALAAATNASNRNR